MDNTILKKAHVQARRMYVLLSEVQDISKQLAEALDRDDQVTARILISMRSEPVRKLSQTKAALEELKNDLPFDEAERLTELLNGSALATEEEQGLATQIQMNQRQLEQVLLLDQGLNRKITREKSFYNEKPSPL